MYYSLNIQAICDAFGRFTNVEIKWPGSVHDARVFANSSIQKSFLEKKFTLFHKELLPGRECVPQLLLGDPAYPLLPYLMKEYDSCQTNEQVIFNQMLRSSRSQIECAFGRLKARWRILTRPLDIPTQSMPNVICACFVLHNFCELHKIEADSAFVDSVVTDERSSTLKKDRLNTYSSKLGSKVRETITDYFKEFM